MSRANATELVSPLERLGRLHTVPLLAELGAGELITIAEQCREMSFWAGERLVDAETPPTHIHFIVSGQAALFESGRIIRSLNEDDSVGLLTVLAQRQEPLETVAMTSMRTLAISSELLREILVDRFSVYHALLRSLCALLRSERTFASSTKSTRPGATGSVDGLLSRILLLEHALMFGNRHPLAISQMARRATVRVLEATDSLWEVGDIASGIYVVASGALAGRVSETQFSIEAGSACGFLDTVGGGTRSYAATATEPTTLLRIDHESLLDVLEDHADVAEDCLSKISSAVIDAIAGRVAVTDQIAVGLQSGADSSQD